MILFFILLFLKAVGKYLLLSPFFFPAVSVHLHSLWLQRSPLEVVSVPEYLSSPLYQTVPLYLYGFFLPELPKHKGCAYTDGDDRQ